MIFKPLESAAKIIAGQSPASSTYNSTGDGLPFFQGKADFGEMYPTVRMWCTSPKRKEAEIGDILMSVRAPVGAVNICNQKSIIGRGLSAIRPHSSLNALFLYYFLKANERQIAALGTGSTFKAITQKTLKKIEIPLLPLDDQKCIAHLLGKVEGLIARRKQHLQQLDDLLKSVFLEVFGDPVRNEKGWEKKTAIDYSKCIVPGRDKPKNFSGDIPWVTTNDLKKLSFTHESSKGIGLTTEEIEEVRARIIPAGSVLLTCVGDLGVVSICAKDMVVNQQLHSYQVSKTMNNIFFMFALSFQKSFMYRNASKTTVPYMNKTICNSIPMFAPPIDLQNQFATIVEKVETLKSRYQQSLTDLENLYGALSQKAFKGELDLSQVLLSVETTTEEEDHEKHEIHEMETAFELPAPADVAILHSAEGRKALLDQWLSAWLEQLGDEPFAAQLFMETAQQRLWKLAEDEAPDWAVAEYDELKALVFEALEHGRLTQGYDDINNRVQLKTARS